MEQLKKFNEMLVERNKVVNLTAHKTLESSWVNNVLDSLLFVDTFETTLLRKCSPDIFSVFCEKNSKNAGCRTSLRRSVKCGIKMLDLGSGCGCPAIPLKIALPHLDVTMIDSVRKKTDFLNEVVTELGLENIRAIHTRIEDYVTSPHCAHLTFFPFSVKKTPKTQAVAPNASSMRESFDIVTARAVAELPTLLEYALPFLRIGGKLFAFKGKNYQSEIDASANALKVLGGEISDIKKANREQINLTTPSALKLDSSPTALNDIERYLVIVTKVRPTPTKYPRGKNLPRLKPL